MRTSRLFVDQTLSPGAIVTLDEGTARYANQVLRLKRGQDVTLFNGRGGEYHAHFLVVSRRVTKAEVDSHVAVERESPLRVHLGQGLARSERMDVVVQKAVELGVASITPLNTDRSVVKLTGERLERRVGHWRSIAIHACQQCGRNRVPDIHAPLDISSWTQAQTSGLRLLLSPHTERTLKCLQMESRSVSLLIGPEGGMSEREIEISRAAEFVPIRFGNRVLRAETASVAAVTAVQLKWGDLD